MSDDPKKDRPTECSIEYMTGRDGYYVKKVNPLFSAVVRVGSHPEMDPIVEELTYHGKKIPGPIFRQWLAFGREVAARCKGDSEAGLILFYHPTERKWGAFPPKQDLSVVSVDFTGVTDCIRQFREEHGKDWLMAGTLHTHPGDAGPSQTDVDDEKKLDGVHLIVPDFGRQKDRGVNCHIVCSGERFVVKKPVGFLIDWAAGLNDAELVVPASWHEQVKFGRGSYKTTYVGGEHGEGYYGGGYRNGYSTGSPHVFKGEGPGIHTATVNGVELNLLGKLFEDRDGIKPVLKRLKYTKNERKFLVANFEDDFEDMLVSFDKAREALKFVKEIRGTISEHEHGEIVDKVGDATMEILDAMVRIADRMLEQAGEKSPSKPAPTDGKEDEDKDEEEGEAKLSSGEKSASVSDVDHRDI